MSNRVLLVLLSVIAVIAPLSASAQDGCLQSMEDGLKHYQLRNYEAALDEFQDVLDQQICTGDQRVEAHMYMARIFMTNNDKEMARKHMIIAHCLDPFLWRFINKSGDTKDFFDELSIVSNDILRDPSLCLEPPQPPPPPPPPPEIEELFPEKQPGDESAITIEEGTTVNQADIDAENRRLRMRAAGWTLFGVGGVSAAGAGTMFMLAVNEDDKQREATEEGDEAAHDEHWANTKNYAVASYVLGGVAVVSLSTSIALLAASSDKHALLERPGFELSAAPLLTPDTQGMVFNLRF